MNNKDAEMIVKYSRPPKRKRCQRCGKLTPDWEKRGGFVVCWPCAKAARLLGNVVK